MLKGVHSQFQKGPLGIKRDQYPAPNNNVSRRKNRPLGIEARSACHAEGPGLKLRINPEDGLLPDCYPSPIYHFNIFC